ncbi:helix-turn-helix domain-containing protein [Brevibacterium antiquum]|uniref:DNA binding domain-containing protein, excisionase family n=1 Tax=Brevibacterium antiquum TaxID=234835 RepID=A0A2H1IMP9_9MICO|nr:helix-turn-helix domain-containing protein [Brevibacterium antiquum]SMX76443.1 DNA binding domain-containing protein, excisionase family [Brevibacterium antiquum]
MIALNTLWTTSQVAERLNCSTTTVNRRRKAGLIKAFDIGGSTFRFDPKEIDRYLNANAQKGDAA